MTLLDMSAARIEYVNEGGEEWDRMFQRLEPGVPEMESGLRWQYNGSEFSGDAPNFRAQHTFVHRRVRVSARVDAAPVWLASVSWKLKPTPDPRVFTCMKCSAQTDVIFIDQIGDKLCGECVRAESPQVFETQ